MFGDLSDALNGILSNYDLVYLPSDKHTVSKVLMCEDLVSVANNDEQLLRQIIGKTLSEHIVISEDFAKIADELTEKTLEFSKARAPYKVPDKDEVTKVLTDVISGFCGSAEDTKAMVESLMPYVMNTKSNFIGDINTMVDDNLRYPWSVEFENIRKTLVGEVSLAIADYFGVATPRLTTPKPEGRARAVIPYLDRQSMRAMAEEVLAPKSAEELSLLSKEVMDSVCENLPSILDWRAIESEIKADLLTNGVKSTHTGVPQMVKEIVSAIIMNSCAPRTSDPNIQYESTKADIIKILTVYGVEMDGCPNIKEDLASIILFNNTVEGAPSHMEKIMSIAVGKMRGQGTTPRGCKNYAPHLVSGAYKVLYKVKAN